MRPPDYLCQPDPMRTAAHRRPYDREQVQRYDDQLAQLDRDHRAQQLATKIRAMRRPPPGTPHAERREGGPAAFLLPGGSENRISATTAGSGGDSHHVARNSLPADDSGGVRGAPDSPRSGEIRIDLRRLRRAELIAKCERLGVLTDAPRPGRRAAAVTAGVGGAGRFPGEVVTGVTASVPVRRDNSALWKY